MESPTSTNPEEKISTALTSKWSKLTSPEVKEIVQDHDKLPEVLKRRYSMSKDDAQRASLSFFKPYERKKFSGQKN